MAQQQKKEDFVVSSLGIHKTALKCDFLKGFATIYAIFLGNRNGERQGGHVLKRIVDSFIGY